MNVEGDVKGCIIKTDSVSFGNLEHQTIEEIHNTDRWKSIQYGCKTDNPDDHCKNCSYKEITPMLTYLQVEPDSDIKKGTRVRL